jgi:small subunit ribosomal protein S20
LPRSKSSQKQVRVAGRRRAINKSTRSLCKTNVTGAEKLIFLGELETAKGAVDAAVVSLDKAAEKGIVHPNQAARRKSRLVKKMNQAQAAPAAEPKVKAKAKAKAKPAAKPEPALEAAPETTPEPAPEPEKTT